MKKENNQRTIFHEKQRGGDNGVSQIANNAYLNFWSN